LTQYKIVLTSTFKKQLRLLKKRNKDLSKLTKVVNDLSRGVALDEKYKDHQLFNSTRFKNCRECHIEPDWLLVYMINNKKLILFLVETGTHSDLF